MAEFIGLTVFLLTLAVWFAYSVKSLANKKKIKKNYRQSLEKQEEVETRIRKIEDVYGEKSTLIMFQELAVPNICELLVILEEAQIILILGEAYNFSEILNFKIGQLDYIRSKYTAKATPPKGILEKISTGYFAGNTIKEALLQLEEMQETITCSSIPEQTAPIDIMTSRLDEPTIRISPSSYSADEVITALSIIIDKNESKWKSVELNGYSTS